MEQTIAVVIGKGLLMKIQTSFPDIVLTFPAMGA